MDFVSLVNATMRDQPFSHFGLTRFDKPLSMELYRTWLSRGHHGDMNYLADQASAKADPRLRYPKARSAIVVAKSYLPQHPYPMPTTPLGAARMAAYAKGGDYHLAFRSELVGVANSLSEKLPGEEFLCFTDSAPILERDLAYRAGLGWIGKNTCLIHPKAGSFFFLGQILTSVDLERPQGAVAHDSCGTCDRCLRACPTGALEEPRVLNANKCIAYWTIEAKSAPENGWLSNLGDWFFGCDICQAVCPWNEKAHGREMLQGLLAEDRENRATLVQDLRWLLVSSHREISRRLEGTPILRARPRGLKRNAIVIAGNRRLVELKPEIELATSDPLLKRVAQWALELLN